MKEARELLESQRIDWQRDWDALFVGFIVGVLVTLVLGFSVRLFVDPHYRPVATEQR